MYHRLVLFFILASAQSIYSQTNADNDRIAEFYDLINQQSISNTSQVAIYNKSVKGKRLLDDSTLVSKISMLNIVSDSHIDQDTINRIVIQYEKDENDKRKPIKRMTYNKEWNLISSEVINEKLETLSKTNLLYEDNLLVKEEAYTGFAYLDEPRKLSLIEYVYEGDRLVTKNKKYSLNGTHWIENWTTHYDESGHVVRIEEKSEGQERIFNYNYENGKVTSIDKIENSKKVSVKSISYDNLGRLKEITVRKSNNKKILRCTRYYYN